MKIIDADELMNTLGAIHNKIGAEFDYKRIMQEIRQRARHNNVKVIPIEWIKSNINVILDSYPNGNEETEILCKLLYEWEKENGRSE